ncbi:MAG: DUF3500 domain-containing protein [Cyclobacteriaceae bacterium]
MKRFLLTLAAALVQLTSANSQTDYQKEIKQYSVVLYGSLSKTQKQAGLLAFNDTSRLKWNNLPVGLRARAGVSIGNMTNDQRRLLHRMLSASLSSQGYLKATGIMHLDELINRFYDSLYLKKEIDDRANGFVKKLMWSPRNYYFAFFGSPSDEKWGYKLEGHHLSINFTFTGNTLSVTPLFVGTDPAEYLISEYAGWRVLGQEEDLGLKLINSLTQEQQKKAISTKDVPRDIITAAESGKRLVDDWGIKASELRKEQQALLLLLVREFVFNLDHDKAIMEFDKIEKAGIGNVYFGWIGASEEMKAHYFVLNGPTFLIEFDNNGGPRGGANHIHAIWREKGNEYGEDVLKEHYQTEKH